MTTSAQSTWNVPLISQRIVVTGGGSGMGRGTALELARSGAKVYILGRREQALQGVAEEARDLSGEIVPIVCDVLDVEAIDRAFGAIEADGGPVQGLAHCAAAVNYTPAAEMTPRGFQEVIASVLFGAFNVLERWGKSLLAAELPGAAVFVTSAIASRGTPGASHSSAGKAGVEAMVKTVAREWGHAGIRLNVMGPGFFPVERNEDLVTDPVFKNSVEEKVSLQRMGTLAEAIQPIVFLLSEAASYITGEVLEVDGGFRLTPYLLPQWSYETGVPIDG